LDLIGYIVDRDDRRFRLVLPITDCDRVEGQVPVAGQMLIETKAEGIVEPFDPHVGRLIILVPARPDESPSIRSEKIGAVRKTIGFIERPG